MMHLLFFFFSVMMTTEKKKKKPWFRMGVFSCQSVCFFHPKWPPGCELEKGVGGGRWWQGRNFNLYWVVNYNGEPFCGNDAFRFYFCFYVSQSLSKKWICCSLVCKVGRDCTNSIINKTKLIYSYYFFWK